MDGLDRLSLLDWKLGSEFFYLSAAVLTLYAGDGMRWRVVPAIIPRARRICAGDRGTGNARTAPGSSILLRKSVKAWAWAGQPVRNQG